MELLLKLARESKDFRKKLISKISKDKKLENSWRVFWGHKYDNGKKMVRNPNPDGVRKKVRADTAMKDESFKKKVKREFEKYVEQSKKKKKAPKNKVKSEKGLGKKLMKEERFDKDVRREKMDKGKKRKEAPGSFPPKKE